MGLMTLGTVLVLGDGLTTPAIAQIDVYKRQELIRERVIAGIRYAQSRGIHVGRPRMKIDAAMAAHRAAGLSYRAIARELGVSVPTVWKRLRKAA